MGFLSNATFQKQVYWKDLVQSTFGNKAQPRALSKLLENYFSKNSIAQQKIYGVRDGLKLIYHDSNNELYKNYKFLF